MNLPGHTAQDGASHSCTPGKGPAQHIPSPPWTHGCLSHHTGGMAEWFKAVVLKTTDGATRPGVRIPLPPPHYLPSTSKKIQKASSDKGSRVLESPGGS